MIGTTVSHYRILDKIGEGGMGVVYKAQDTRLERLVAVKFLPPGLASTDSARHRFVNEARAASALNHPNVAIVYDVGEGETGSFIVMELVEGRRRSFMMDTDWGAWSRESVALMKTRNAEWPARYGIQGAPYRWDLEKGTIRFGHAAGDVVASLCLVGTVAGTEGTFLWSWADGGVPGTAREGVDQVRRFGEDHDLPLLVSGEVDGGHAQALELVAIAGRILDADGVFIDRTADMTLYFTLTGFGREDGTVAATPNAPGS